MTLRLVDLTELLREIHVGMRIPYISTVKIKKTIRIFYLRFRQRRQLLEMSEHALKDIGVTRSEVIEEASKPFWEQ